jgi:UDP-N-acetylglucosamine 4,6-dehydratase/5-epimerase
MTEFAGKKVVILGGTGTLGRALTQLIVDEYSDINQLTIFSRDEVKQLEMMADFPEEDYPFLSYLLGDVRDLKRLEEVIQGHDMIIHAAAIKHVVMAERNPEECRKTNIIGSENVVKACLKQGVERAILISTDKAIKPIGVYGMSKQRAEAIFINANKGQITKFGIVRLGNIYGSRGSVVEAFEQQRKTGVLKVTDEKATRFYISPKDASLFLISSLLHLNGGEIVFPKMKAFRVIDLANLIAPECNVEITGLRPGDKLHEEIGGISSAECLEMVNLIEY